jgi:FecR protein
MISRKLIPSILVILLCALFAGVQPAAADSSHARIIRLSLVQGDVRISRDAHGDALADSSAAWETAELNLPIHQGYVLATDKGRAEIEFENGAMAFLKENTILEFYDLSLNDGARTTRLVLRQGSASFYVNPSSGDYFSVTGGDFTVEANGRSSFRLDNYDDGSTVETMKGHVSVLHKDKPTLLEKGQSLSLKAGDDASLSVGRLAEEDDFDRWVSGRVDSVATATNAALQYTSSPYYASGFADLYTYGSWSSCGGSGYGWRPFGVGAAWSPFTMGQWLWDPGFGWTWMSSQPWGWAPYHYGGWLFDSSCGGWFYSPPVLYGFPGGPRNRFPRGVHPPQPVYRPVTGVFVRNNGKMGIVPIHPLDEKGKTPLNLEHGVFSPVLAKGMSERISGGEFGQKWETLKSAPREALTSNLVATTPPARVSRTIVEGNSGARVISLSKDSSIAYDPRGHRFVNTNAPATSSSSVSSVNARESHSENGQTGVVAGAHAGNASGRTVIPNPATASSSRSPSVPSVARTATPAPPARSMTPPPAPRSSGGERGGSSGSSGRGSSWGGSSSSSGGSSSGRSSSGSSSGSSSHPSGGRPH